MTEESKIEKPVEGHFTTVRFMGTTDSPTRSEPPELSIREGVLEGSKELFPIQKPGGFESSHETPYYHSSGDGGNESLAMRLLTNALRRQNTERQLG